MKKYNVEKSTFLFWGVWVRRKYKIFLIIFISIVLAYFIYFINHKNKINVVVIGDGIASGETAYNIDGISYSDYLKEYLENKHLLHNYNATYAFKNYKMASLLNDLKSNIISDKDKLTIQQLIHKADLIILNIGEEELVKAAITNDLTKESLDEFIKEYDDLLYFIKDISEAKVVIVGFYGNKYLKESNTIILNSEIANAALKYDSIFINISDLMKTKEYFVNKDTYYFNYKGHKAIAEMIIHSL